MARQLRPRKSAPSYVALAGITGEDIADGAGPSNAVTFEDEDSGSEFAPEKEVARSVVEEEEEDEEEDEPEASDPDDFPVPVRKVKAAASKPKTKTIYGIKLPSARSGLNAAANVKRQMYALPTPSVYHRHKATPLFSRSGRVERLTAPPILFSAPEIAYTNNFTDSKQISDRLSKSWSYNVGSGPLWEIVEDRAWFKEGGSEDSSFEDENTRRPLVYTNVKVKSGLQLLDSEYVSSLVRLHLDNHPTGKLVLICRQPASPRKRGISCPHLLSHAASDHLTLKPESS